MKRPSLGYLLAVGFVLLVSLIGGTARSSLAATFTVTNTDDSGPGSLRQAIADANVNHQDDTIIFDSATFSISQTITLTTGEMMVLADTNSVPGTFCNTSVLGPGSALLTIDGNNQSRIFHSQGSGYALSISDITLKHGFATLGGAIYAAGNDLNLFDMVLSDNSVAGGDVGPGQFAAGRGGAVYADGANIVNSVFTNNTASGILQPANQTFAASGTAGAGGAVFISGFSSNIINCTFSNNQAKGITSGPTNGGQFEANGGSAYGGAVYGFFSLQIINSRFLNNSALAGDGGSDITFGVTGGNGGDANGGAVRSSGGVILNSTFSNNTSTSGNGGNAIIPSKVGKGGPSFGGGIYDTSVKIANSTIVNNITIAGNGRIGGNAAGGGFYGGDGHQWTVTDATITGNNVTGGSGTQTNGVSQGGGMYGIGDSPPSSTLRNNIIAENSAVSGPDAFFGNSVIASNNLVGVGDVSTGVTGGVTGNIVGTAASPINPLLGPLADNGGVTQTRALLAGSPAIDAGNNAVFNLAFFPPDSHPLLFDQRNFQRINPAGGTIDIGAYEFGSPTTPLASSIPDLQSTSDSGTSTTDNITRSTAPAFDILNTIPGAKIELLRDGVVVASSYALLFSLSITDSSPPSDAVVQYTGRQTIGGVTSAVTGPLSVTFDHIAPTATFNQAASQLDPTRFTPINFTAVFSERVSSPGLLSYQGSTANVNGASQSPSSADGITWNIAVSGVSSNGLTVVANLTTYQDLAGNSGAGASSIDNSVTLDNVRPAVTVNQAAGQADPTNLLPINYSVIFSEPVTGFDASDLSFSGSTLSTAAATKTITGSGTTYNVAIGNFNSNGGLLRVSVLSGAAADSLGNTSLGSTASDNMVTFDNTPPSVTINQAVGQADPTNVLPINYRVVFSEPVTGFEATDLSFSGSSIDVTNATKSITGSGTTYNVAIGNLNSDGGLLSVSVVAGATTDSLGNTSLASNSSDNAVIFDNTPPTVTIDQAAGQSDPTSAQPINFTVLFSEPVTGFTASDVSLAGSTADISAANVVVTGAGSSFNVAISHITSTGVVNAIVTAGATQDATGNQSVASTSGDNSVTLNFATVSGRVLTPEGRGLRGAVVTITDSQSVVRTATTNSFGSYTFDSILSGAPYTIRVSSKLYRFASQVIQVNDNVTNLDFLGQE